MRHIYAVIERQNKITKMEWFNIKLWAFELPKQKKIFLKIFIINFHFFNSSWSFDCNNFLTIYKTRYFLRKIILWDITFNWEDRMVTNIVHIHSRKIDEAFKFMSSSLAFESWFFVEDHNTHQAACDDLFTLKNKL